MYNKCELFTDDENLFDKISLKRAKEIIQRNDTLVHSSEISFNTYGEFLFIIFKYKESIFVMYGLGEHCERERWVEDFNIDTGQEYNIRGTVPIAKSEVLNQINERAKLKKYYTYEQSFRGELYDILADIGDEDGAASILSDYDFMLGDE
jgi:hypothetical protein